MPQIRRWATLPEKNTPLRLQPGRSTSFFLSIGLRKMLGAPGAFLRELHCKRALITIQSHNTPLPLLLSGASRDFSGLRCCMVFQQDTGAGRKPRCCPLSHTLECLTTMENNWKLVVSHEMLLTLTCNIFYNKSVNRLCKSSLNFC